MELRITPIDDAKQDSGVWATYRGVELLIARSTTARYVRELRRMQKPYQKQLAQGTHDPQRFQTDVHRAVAKCLLLDWRGLIVNGEEIPYSEDNAFQLLEQDPDAREFIAEFSTNIDNFLNEELEEAAKN